jgi:predicted HicB family RNase H-like nuclease
MSFYEYKGYIGSAEVDTASEVLVGKLLFIRDSIAYSAGSPKALEKAFHDAVDEYLATCAQFGDQPELPCKGSFNVRIEPEQHRAKGVTLNQFVAQAIQIACSDKDEHHTHMTVRIVRPPTTGIASAGITAQWETPHGHATH